MPSGVENSKACGVMVTGPRPGTVVIPCQCKQVMLITVFKEGHTAVVCMQWQRRVTVRRTDLDAGDTKAELLVWYQSCVGNRGPVPGLQVPAQAAELPLLPVAGSWEGRGGC